MASEHGKTTMASKMQTLDIEVPIKHPASLVWQTYVKNLQKSSSVALLPGHLDKVEYLEGPPLAPGGVFIATYHESVPHYSYIKLRWDEIDHDRHCFKCTLVDGGALGKHFASLAYYFKILPATDLDSCVMQFTVEYEDIGEHTFHDFIKEEIQKLCKSLESHLSSL